MSSLPLNRRYQEARPGVLQAEALDWGNVAEGWVRSNSRLMGLLQLEDGWDGEDAKAPDPRVIRSVFDLLDQLREARFPPPDRIVAGLEGELVLEWQQPPWHFELETSRPYHGEWMVKREGKREFIPDSWQPEPKANPTELSWTYQ